MKSFSITARRQSCRWDREGDSDRLSRFDRKEGDWSTVDLAPVKPLHGQLHFAKSKPSAAKRIVLVRQSRLSVMPLRNRNFAKL